MTKHIGGNVDYWLFDVTETFVNNMIISHSEEIRLENEASDSTNKLKISDNNTKVRIKGLWSSTIKKLKLGGRMKREKIMVDGREIEVREMTYSEINEVKKMAEKNEIDESYPLIAQFTKSGKINELNDLGVSDIILLVNKIYELTFGVKS